MSIIYLPVPMIVKALVFQARVLSRMAEELCVLQVLEALSATSSSSSLYSAYRVRVPAGQSVNTPIEGATAETPKTIPGTSTPIILSSGRLPNKDIKPKTLCRNASTL